MKEFILFYFLSTLPIALTTSFIAICKEKNRWLWFSLSICVGILATLVLLMLPGRKKKAITEEGCLFSDERELSGESFFEERNWEDSQTLSPQSDKIENFPIPNGWYYIHPITEEQKGPSSFQVLVEAWQGGILNGESFVWNPDLSDWIRIRNHKEYLKWFMDGSISST